MGLPLLSGFFFRLLLLSLSDGCFLLLPFGQKLSVPARIAIVRLFTGNGDVVFLVDTEELPQFHPELPVAFVHPVYLVLYVFRGAQPARAHRKGFIPLGIELYAALLQTALGQQIKFPSVQIVAVRYGIEVRFPFGCYLDGLTYRAVYLLLQTSGKHASRMVVVETDMLPAGEMKTAFRNSWFCAR